MARETWGRSLFARRAPGAVRGPCPWYLGCGNWVYRWYWTLEAVPENAVNEHGIMDHNNLKGEDGDDVGFEKTRDASSSTAPSSRHYVTSKWFWLDLVSCVPFAEIFTAFDDKNVKSATKNTGLIKALKLLRLFRLSKIMKKLEKRTQGGVQFTKLLFAVMLSVHWIACGWKGIDDVWRCGDGNAYEWPGAIDDDDGPDDAKRRLGARVNRRCRRATFYTAYSDCIHQACISINGDGRAITNREQVFFAFVVIYGSIMQAAIFGKMAGLLHRLDEAHQNYQTKLITVQKRVGYMGLPPDLQDRILRYYEQLWEKDRSVTPDTHHFLKELTPRLQLDARLAIYADLIKRIPFMQRITRNMLEHLVMQMKPTIYMESESMMRKHDIGDWMAFVESGMLAVLDPGSQRSRILKLMHAGDHVGERALLDQTPRSATVIALVWTVNVLTRDDWDRARAFPAEAERVQQDLVSHSSRKAKPRLEDGDAEEKADRRSASGVRGVGANILKNFGGKKAGYRLTQQRKVAAEVK
ncbi:voltage-gated potassium channel [Aureococcus anophagefferens]|nr:voltage-gated potassium channel [Aureococcus anophagefferens]